MLGSRCNKNRVELEDEWMVFGGMSHASTFITHIAATRVRTITSLSNALIGLGEAQSDKAMRDGISRGE